MSEKPGSAKAAATAPARQRRLAVRHETHYAYDTPVEVAHHSAWLRPRDTAWQRVHGWQMSIAPEPDCAVQESTDAFGNWRHGFSHARVHEQLAVVSSFEVDITEPLDPANFATSATWEQAAQDLRYSAGRQQPDAVAFLLGTHFAPQDERLAEFGDGLFLPERPLADLACALMTRVHERMDYKPLSTDVATSALDALAKGQGVCQDFAHLMIGVLRSHGLAARYVSGYLLTQPPPGQPRLVGADASHAWVSVWCPRLGWLALDPTNNIAAGLDHVTLAWGRDYADVAPLRGVIRGGGAALPSVAVTVQPVDAPPGSGTSAPA
jgi:transglutaminase-like putative cysteine protease